MSNKRHLHRLAVLALTGGFMLQVTGCVSGLAPVFASFVESTLLSLLLGGVLPQ